MDNTGGKERKTSPLKVFIDFLKIGSYAYGGPAAITYIYDHYKKQINENRLKEGLALVQMSPGPIGVNFSSFVGYELAGPIGAIIAPLGFILPTTIMVTILSLIYVKYSGSETFKKIVDYLYPVIDAIILSAAINFSNPYFKRKDYKAILLGVFAFIALLLRINPVYTVLMAGIIGIFIFHEIKEIGLKSKVHLIKGKIFVGCLGLVVLILALLILKLTNKALFEMGFTFGKISAVAFGGGFGALPLLIHELTEKLHWFNIKTVMDGVIIGSITPGPVISISTFVGLVRGGIPSMIVATVYAYFTSIFIFNFFTGIQPIVTENFWYPRFIKGAISSFIGLLFYTFYKTLISTKLNLVTLIILTLSSYLLLTRKISPLALVIIGATTFTSLAILNVF